MKLPKTIFLSVGLASLGLSRCTNADHNAPTAQDHGYTAADSVAADALAKDLEAAFDRRDTVALERITADMLRSPFVRNDLPQLMSVMDWRNYAMAPLPFKERYPAEMDSMLANAAARNDTLMMFAVLNNLAKLTMQRERDLAKALDYREEALRLDPRQVLIEQVPDLYRQLAEDYDNVKQWDRSLLYSSRMVSHGLGTGDTALACWGQVYMAAEFQQLGVPDSIDPHLQRGEASDIRCFGPIRAPLQDTRYWPASKGSEAATTARSHYWTAFQPPSRGWGT